MHSRLFPSRRPAGHARTGRGGPGDALTAAGAVQVTNDPAPLRSHSSSPRIAVNPQTGEVWTNNIDYKFTARV